MHNYHEASMEGNTGALETALRILTAIVEGAEPDGTDVAELHRVLPFGDDDPLDEVARSVVHQTACYGFVNGEPPFKDAA
jgi:hypothetical protein